MIHELEPETKPMTALSPYQNIPCHSAKFRLPSSSIIGWLGAILKRFDSACGITIVQLPLVKESFFESVSFVLICNSASIKVTWIVIDVDVEKVISESPYDGEKVR